MELITHFINILLHLDKHLNIVIQNYGSWANLILFFIIFCETGLVVTPFLPGDSLLFAAGTFAASDSLNFGYLLILLAMAVVAGDTVNYSIGHLVGPRVFCKENVRFLNKRYLERAHEFYERHGGKAIILARFIPIIRTFVPFVAGVANMNYLRFVSYNVIGGSAWVVILISAGYFFGNISIIKRNFTLAIYAIIFISILPGIIEFLRLISHSERYIRINHLVKSISTKSKPRLKSSLSKRSLNKWILALISISLFLPWVKFPLSGGVSSFNFYSPILLSWGLLLLTAVVLAAIGIRWSLLLLLILVFSFPLQIHWDYRFIRDVISEVKQKGNIKVFADRYLYEPNIGDEYGPNVLGSQIVFSEISDLWDNPLSRVVLTVKSLGIGFWVAFIGTLIASRTLRKKGIVIALLITVLLSLPGIIIGSFLTMGRKAFLMGNYSRSVDMYRRAMGVNQSLGNGTLKELGAYYLWVGGDLFHMGVKDAPEVYFFLANNLEAVGSFIESKQMYQRSINLPPTKKALAKANVGESLADFEEKDLGAAMERLEEAFRLDNNQVEALFYAIYISSVLKDHQLALYYSDLLFDRCKEKLVLSDLYNILGDTYQKAGNASEARDMYIKSRNVFDRVKNGNYHAWVGIAGW